VVKRTIIVAALATIAGCAGGANETVLNARPRESMAPVAHGDCTEAIRRAVAEPDLVVDSVPRPVTQRPAPFAQMPDSVWHQIRTKGSSVKVNVLVDTLGRPVMKTFTVVESSHPWLAHHLKAAMPRWRFRAARLAGCKVPRIYKFSATSKPRR
jgi:hypothetical protein